MATGITKREQHSLDAISALDFYEEQIPLPNEEAPVTLTYPNKAAITDIVQPFPRRFICVDDQGEKPLAKLLDNSFILDDNFFVLNELICENKKADLFYLDPPYGTGFDFHSRDLDHAYKDTMRQATYLEFMRRRLILMRECMTDTGSIYVHIGHQMLAHLKVLMDEIFGSNNFRNLITRRKCSSKNFTRKQYANINDYILFYSKNNSYTWNQPGVKPEQEWIEKEYPKVDELGRRFKLVPIHAPGTRNGETGQPWRGMVPPPGKHWQYVPSKLDKLDKQGDIHWSRNGNPRRKVYWSADKKTALTDYWEQYRDAHHQSIKITGYPTEKNLEMIKMIVGASSKPNDLVIDPFCGSGTTMQAARDLGRRYIGVDASFSAAKATLQRMRHGLKLMGDYVSGKSKQAKQLVLSDVGKTINSCTFITDSCLLDAYNAEIRELSSI
ncbi:MAG: site-specific DNA-methyltransferase [Symploca sp. SIO1C4]|uniref:Site-specific DNA-methyltransferase n=1 Tax=Symploca sp. SIO1C4 TaxID=2607765 RepID=A0A6B3NDG8_9CYAN|nr:site-specific DNA-methyltransferase [Symploca sp. SIO1C4]